MFKAILSRYIPLKRKIIVEGNELRVTIKLSENTKKLFQENAIIECGEEKYILLPFWIKDLKNGEFELIHPDNPTARLKKALTPSEEETEKKMIL